MRAYWSVESLRGRNDAHKAVYRDVLLAPRLPTAFAAARRSSETVGVGQLVVKRGWAGIQCMATVPSHRRHGIAKAVLNKLAKEATRRGIEQMYLAVMADNQAAQELYASVGFTPVHEYRYFTDAR